MTFGYIGYIWAMFGCCTLFGVFGGSAALLYWLGRKRDREGGGAPSISVDRVDDDRRGGGGGSAA